MKPTQGNISKLSTRSKQREVFYIERQSHSTNIYRAGSKFITSRHIDSSKYITGGLFIHLRPNPTQHATTSDRVKYPFIAANANEMRKGRIPIYSLIVETSTLRATTSPRAGVQSALSRVESGHVCT